MTRQEAFTMLDQMAKGIAEMFGSNCETVIHDLADPLHPVLAIYNGHVSGRSVGSTRDNGISELFDSALLRVGKPAREMNKADRLRVIEYLKNMDAFSYRRAVPYVAAHLGVSRYTIYKYLDEVNGTQEEEAT